MKAIQVRQFGGPEVLELCDVDVPEPRAGEALVRIKAAGVNPYDTYMRAGTYGARNPALPYTPGSDAAGVVERVGAGLDHIAVGTRVYTAGTRTGAYAEFAICAGDQLHLLPERLTYAQGSAVYVPYATAYRALFQMAHAKPGESILVHGGSGGVGIAAIQMARAAGLRVFATAGTDVGRALVREQGASLSFDHRTFDYRDALLEATHGNGVDVIIEVLANVNLGRDATMLAHGGRIVVVGSRGDAQLTPRDLMVREASIHAVLLWSTPTRDATEIHAAIGAGLDNGVLTPIVGAELPLAQAAEAHRRILQSGAAGKIVLVPDE